MGKSSSDADFHVLNFFCDKHGSSALTALTRGVRFHIIVDAEKLDDKTNAGVEYRKLLEDFQGMEADSPVDQSKAKDDTDRDSGVDVNDSDTRTSTKQLDAEVEDPEATLQAWIFAPISTNLDVLISKPKPSEQRTLQNWYHCDTRFCELVVSEDEEDIQAVELESSSELEDRMQKLLPAITLPKYLTNSMDLSQYSASEFEVLEASDQPVGTPYHPCRIRHFKTHTTYFLKVVDNDQPGPMKRELDILYRIRKLSLDQQMRVPLLEGLVSFDKTGSTPSGKTKIMGFIQTDIPSPTHLTTKFDQSIPQAKREGWAKEAGRMKDILHQNKIIWGDAKADNFMVDKDDNLWIIDFGGSYTEGWVDPELNETEAGDDMGTIKTINALKDPVANVQGPEDGGNDEDRGGSATTVGRKRKKVDDDTDSEEDEHTSTKRTRSLEEQE